MPRMIPAQPRAGANKSEQAVFIAFEGIPDRPDWTVIHSLQLAALELPNLLSIPDMRYFTNVMRSVL